jgi:hypothetical protein
MHAVHGMQLVKRKSIPYDVHALLTLVLCCCAAVPFFVGQAMTEQEGARPALISRARSSEVVQDPV